MKLFSKNKLIFENYEYISKKNLYITLNIPNEIQI